MIKIITPPKVQLLKEASAILKNTADAYNSFYSLERPVPELLTLFHQATKNILNQIANIQVIEIIGPDQQYPQIVLQVSAPGKVEEVRHE